MTIDPGVLLERLGIEAKPDRRGRFHALCPNHADRKPSWMFWLEHRDDSLRHKCIACGWGGGAESLVSKVLGIPFKEARAWIESAATAAPRHVALHSEVEIREPRRSHFQLPQGVIQKPVQEWPQPPRQYLFDRGVPDAQAEFWELGYAVDGRLAGRIVIPVRDLNLRLVSYTARAFVRTRRKYLEPTTEEGADKAAIFGEERWPPVVNRDLVVVVEGGFDGMAVERATRLPFAGLYGSEFVPGHAAKLGTWKRILLITDPDDAGERVATEIRGQLGRWATFKRITLPEGEDCASLAKLDLAPLRDRILEAISEWDGIHEPRSVS